MAEKYKIVIEVITHQYETPAHQVSQGTGVALQVVGYDTLADADLAYARVIHEATTYFSRFAYKLY